MNRIKPLNRQSLLDIAIQECGDVEAAMEIASLNGISISDTPDTETELIIPKPRNEKNVALYRAKGVKPATDISTEEQDLATYGGIGYMGIEIDFIVS